MQSIVGVGKQASPQPACCVACEQTVLSMGCAFMPCTRSDTVACHDTHLIALLYSLASLPSQVPMLTKVMPRDSTLSRTCSMLAKDSSKLPLFPSQWRSRLSARCRKGLKWPHSGTVTSSMLVTSLPADMFAVLLYSCVVLCRVRGKVTLCNLVYGHWTKEQKAKRA